MKIRDSEQQAVHDDVSEKEEETESEEQEDVFTNPQRSKPETIAPTAPKRGRPVGSKNFANPAPPLTMDLRERGSVNHVFMATQDPSSVAEAISREDGKQWIKAMEK